jgi:enolase
MTGFDISELSALEILDSRGPVRGERVAKYNRLIEIAAATPGLRYGTS